DSAQAQFDIALAHSDRLTDAERLTNRFFVSYVVNYDPQAALAVSDELIRTPPVNADRFNNRSIVLFDLGRYDEALEAQQRASEPSVFGPSAFLLLNEQQTLLQLGRYDDARSIESKLKGSQLLIAQMSRAVCSDSWARADSVASAVLAG